MPGGFRMAYEVPVGSEHRTMILKTVLERPCAEQNSRGENGGCEFERTKKSGCKSLVQEGVMECLHQYHISFGKKRQIMDCAVRGRITCRNDLERTYSSEYWWYRMILYNQRDY
jgi:hypothetical protein